MIGPWTITIGETTQKFSALTMIDTVTNLVEVVRVSNKTSAHIALQFKKNLVVKISQTYLSDTRPRRRVCRIRVPTQAKFVEHLNQEYNV
jgi:hypothetical protein